MPLDEKNMLDVPVKVTSYVKYVEALKYAVPVQSIKLRQFNVLHVIVDVTAAVIDVTVKFVIVMFSTTSGPLGLYVPPNVPSIARLAFKSS
jgi:hypothetical protein